MNIEEVGNGLMKEWVIELSLMGWAGGENLHLGKKGTIRIKFPHSDSQQTALHLSAMQIPIDSSLCNPKAKK